MPWSETAMRTKTLDVQYNRSSIYPSVEHKMITLYNIAFTEWWIKISGAMVDMMSENARMICYGLGDFIGEL